jgi:hypothetical protein
VSQSLRTGLQPRRPPPSADADPAAPALLPLLASPTTEEPEAERRLSGPPTTICCPRRGAAACLSSSPPRMGVVAPWRPSLPLTRRCLLRPTAPSPPYCSFSSPPLPSPPLRSLLRLGGRSQLPRPMREGMHIGRWKCLFFFERALISSLGRLQHGDEDSLLESV